MTSKSISSFPVSPFSQTALPLLETVPRDTRRRILDKWRQEIIRTQDALDKLARDNIRARRRRMRMILGVVRVHDLLAQPDILIGHILAMIDKCRATASICDDLFAVRRKPAGRDRTRQ